MGRKRLFEVEVVAAVDKDVRVAGLVRSEGRRPVEGGGSV